jgi:hypothetical protein
VRFNIVHENQHLWHTDHGDDMNESKDMLNSILTTAQMGQVGIRCALRMPLQPELRDALHKQLQEYDTVETEACRLASSRGYELRDLEPAVKTMAKFYARTKLYGGDSDSKTAAMMIRGCTKGLIEGTRQMHRMHGSDQQVKSLTQRLLDCENAGIDRMQGFL